MVKRFGGRAVEFSDFPLDHVILRSDRDEIINSMIDEAIVGETFGILFFKEQLNRVKLNNGPQWLIEHFEMVFKDETEHTNLAWRILGWLLEVDQPDDVERTRRCKNIAEQLTKAISVLRAQIESDAAPVNESLGLLDRPTIREIYASEFLTFIDRQCSDLLGESLTKKLLSNIPV